MIKLNKNKVLVSFILILVIILIGNVIYRNSNKDLTEILELEKLIKNQIEEFKIDENDNILDISKIYNDNWDKMYIVSPYADLNTFIEKYKLKLTGKINTNIEIDDSINLILFTKESEVIAYLNHDRSNGDFNSNQLEEYYAKENAKFYINSSKDGIYLSKSN